MFIHVGFGDSYCTRYKDITMILICNHCCLLLIIINISYNNRTPIKAVIALSTIIPGLNTYSFVIGSY